MPEPGRRDYDLQGDSKTLWEQVAASLQLKVLFDPTTSRRARSISSSPMPIIARRFRRSNRPPIRSWCPSASG